MGSSLIARTSQPISFSQRGMSSEQAPLQQSIATFNPALPDRLNIKNTLQQFDVVRDWILMLYRGCDLVPGSLGEFSLVEYVK